jgi:hypothetical protein
MMAKFGILKTIAFVLGVVVLMFFAASAFPQTLPISERVMSEYVIPVSVPERKLDVRVITTKREHDTDKVGNFRLTVVQIVRDICPDTCTNGHKKTIKKKVMEEARDRGFKPVDVFFK